MAEVEVAVQKATTAGIKPAAKTGLNAADTHLIKNDGRTTLNVKNGGAEATKVTIVTPNTSGGNAVADKEVEIAAGEEKIIGPFPKDVYDNAKGKLEVKFSKVVTVTLSPVSVG